MRRASASRSRTWRSASGAGRRGAGGRRRVVRGAAGRIRRPARPLRLRQDHHPQHGGGPVGAHRRRDPHRHRRGGLRPGRAQGRLRVPARHGVSLAHRGSQHRLRPRNRRRAQAGADREGRARRRSVRPCRFRPELPAHALGRHAPARGPDAHAHHGARDPPDGRAVRRARHPHQARDAQDPARDLGARAADRAVRHPRPRRGADLVEPHHPALGASGTPEGGFRGAIPAAARCRLAARDGRVRPPLFPHLAFARAGVPARQGE